MAKIIDDIVFFVKYSCVDNGDNTFEVRAYSVHLFVAANSSYKDLTGRQLCAIVKNGSRSPDDSKEYTITENKNPTITNASTNETYY